MTQPDDLGEVAEALDIVGMNKEEANLYLHLLQAGPSKVGNLAPYFNCSRAKLYQLLDDLSRKGFVSKTPERPTKYHPVFPEKAFDVGRRTLDRRRQRLEQVHGNLVGLLRNLHRAPDGPEPTEWNKVEGIERIYGVLQRLISQASSSIVSVSNVASSVSPNLPFVQETWLATQRRIKETGLATRCIYGPGVDAVERVPDWLTEVGGQVRIFDEERELKFVLVDERELVFWIDMGSRGPMSTQEDVAIHTNAPGPVTTHAILFEQLWEESLAPCDHPDALGQGNDG